MGNKLLLTVIGFFFIVRASASISNSITLQHTEGCVPMAVLATSAENSSAPVIERQWLLLTCSGDTVFAALNNSSVFSYFLSVCGCYRLTLVSTNQIGESASVTSPITVHCNPQISPVITSNCTQPATLVLHPNIATTNNIDSLWIDWGCGTDDFVKDNIDSIIRTPNCPDGCYNIIIAVIDTNNCYTDTVIQSAYCLPGNVLQAAGYVSQDFIPCPNQPIIIQYFDTTPGNIVSREWSFGDGSFSSQKNPTHLYANSGCYEVKLTVVNFAGCSSTSIIDTICFGGPNAIVTITPQEVCTCLDSVEIVIVPENASEFTLVFGCSTGFITRLIDTLPSSFFFKTMFCVNDTCQPQIILKDTSGCISLLNLPAVFVDSPVVNFTHSYFGTCAGDTTCFTDLTTYSLDVTRTTYREWNFGDGSPIDTNNNPCHIYTQAGVYSVSLKIYSSGGCVDSITLPVEIRGAPIASFTYSINDTSCNNAALCFTNTSLPSPGSDTLYKVWNLGDGISPPLLGDVLCHGYFTEAAYDVVLTVTDEFGCSASDTQLVSFTFHKLIPRISLIGLTDTCFSSKVCIADSSISEGGQVIQRMWHLAGQAIAALGVDTCFKLLVPGQQAIKLEVGDNTGCTVETSILVTPNFGKPDAKFTYSIAGNNVMFLNTSTGRIDSVLWDFGNQTYSGSFNTTQTFQYDSTYNVVLTVIDSSGCIDTTGQTIVMPADTTADTTTIGLTHFKDNLEVTINPNPFTVYTTVKIDGVIGEVTLQLINLLGEQVSTPLSATSGNYTIDRDGLPGGIYILGISRGSSILGKYKLVVH